MTEVGAGRRKCAPASPGGGPQLLLRERSALPRRLQQPCGRGARLVGDRGAGEHAGDLLAPRRGVERHDPRRDPLRRATASLAMRKWLRARAATCGAWVTAMTCTPLRQARQALRRWRRRRRRRRRCRSRRRRASAPSRLSASTTFSASMKRASSPPEATFISGPGACRGWSATQNSTRSNPAGSRPSLVRRDLGDEAGALELQRRQLLLHRAVERLRGAPPRRRRAFAPRRHRRRRPRRPRARARRALSSPASIACTSAA